MLAKASELEKVARKLGFEKMRQKGSHARWKHADGRSTKLIVIYFFQTDPLTARVSSSILCNLNADQLTIPIHGKAEIGSWLFYEILKQLGITEEEFEALR